MLLLPLRFLLPTKPAPWATWVLVGVNVLVYLLGLGELVDLETWQLDWGELHPWRWLVSSYVHMDAWHLAGNLFLLVVTAPVLEELVGSGKTLGLAVLTGLLQAALEQGIYHAVEGGSYGFSSVAFGLIAAVAVLAPTARLELVYWRGLGITTHRLRMSPILLLFLLLGWSFFADGTPLTGILHLLGVGVAVPLTYLGLATGVLTSERRDRTVLDEDSDELRERLDPDLTRPRPSAGGGGRCARCGRTLSRRSGRCLYCGGAGDPSPRGGP